MDRIVIIGAGQAGLSVAAHLRAKKFDGPITLIGDEATAPYQRPPLSKKYMTGEIDLDGLLLRPANFYDDQKIDLILSTSVTSIDPQAREISMGTQKMGYDTLVLATGSRPRLLPDAMGGDLGGIHYIRTLADIDALKTEFTEDARLLIIGGGYIGLETAAVAVTRGLKTTLIEAAPRILQRVACEQTSDFFRSLHLGHGVDLRENTGLVRLIGTDGRVSGAELSDGNRVDVDIVVAGIGILPDTTLAESAGLKLDNGIWTDALGRTSDPNIFAAGDCTSFPWRDGRLRLESVPNAIDQAKVVAEAILGRTDPYIARPWFWSDQYDVKLQIAGLNTGYDMVVTRPASRQGAVSFWYFRAEELIAVDAANDPGAYMMGKRWIETGKTPDPLQIADAGVDLKAITVRDIA